MKKTDFDLIIIGGGATGAGIALDASLRGLSVALFEQNDFGEGTSSRSTKLVHGGVRYLEAAVKRLDKSQYALVREGLKERQLFLSNARHLAHPIELITPLYKWWEVPYIYAGLFL
jgi:glycerol-3-phosphate dehydrogenase